MRAHDVVVTVDDVRVVVLDPTGIRPALDLIERTEATTGAALVDEGERRRLDLLARDPAPKPDSAVALPPPGHWHPLLATCGDDAVAYAGTMLVPEGERVIADVALDRGRAGERPVLRALLDGARLLADAHDARRLEVWVRHAQEADLVAATEAGFGVARRLAVLSLALPRAAEGGPDGTDLRVRAATPEDGDALVALLAGAYDGTPDGGWTVERLARRIAGDWFRWEDVLVGERGGAIVGVHWTKRRGGGIGEVYNLAVAPAARGAGVGATLLAAGLDHLASIGMREALLWVDLANERAVRLYGSFGFVLTWEDVLLGRTLGP